MFAAVCLLALGRPQGRPQNRQRPRAIVHASRFPLSFLLSVEVYRMQTLVGQCVGDGKSEKARATEGRQGGREPTGVLPRICRSLRCWCSRLLSRPRLLETSFQLILSSLLFATANSWAMAAVSVCRRNAGSLSPFSTQRQIIRLRRSSIRSVEADRQHCWSSPTSWRSQSLEVSIEAKSNTFRGSDLLSQPYGATSHHSWCRTSCG